MSVPVSERQPQCAASKKLLKVLVDDLADLLFFVRAELHRLAAVAHVVPHQRHGFFHRGRGEGNCIQLGAQAGDVLLRLA